MLSGSLLAKACKLTVQTKGQILNTQSQRADKSVVLCLGIGLVSQGNKK
jgi:hypothetical protein